MDDDKAPLRPAWITFTGVDEMTELKDVIDLSRAYPVEMAFLMSPRRQGTEPRYPELKFIQDVAHEPRKLRFAAHLCGGYARDVFEGNWGRTGCPVNMSAFGRIQVNNPGAEYQNRTSVDFFSRMMRTRVIVQCADAFINDDRFDWLRDQSGGRGVLPEEQPRLPQLESSPFCGFAGGITPDNVAEVVRSIDATQPYWIDIESGVRSSYDLFDIERCWSVCEAVYGKRPRR